MDDKLSGELKAIKCEVRSLLLSSPTVLGIPQFLKDYRTNMGRPLPFAKFGFSDAKSFLASLTDVLTIRDPWGNSYLQPIATAATAHIDQLVKGQKTTSQRKRFRPGVIPPFRPQLCRNAPPQPCRNAPPPLCRNATPPPPSTTCPPQSMTIKVVRPPPGFENVKPTSVPSSTYSSVAAGPPNSKMAIPKSTSSPMPSSVQQTTCNGSMSHSILDTSPICRSPSVSNVSSTKENGDSKSTTGFSELTDEVRQNFVKILRLHPDGITSSNFLNIYQVMFGSKLDARDLGFPSFLAMVVTFPDIFAVTRTSASSAWTLYDAQKKPETPQKLSTEKIPDSLDDQIAELCYSTPSGIPIGKILDSYKKKYRIQIDVKALGFQTFREFIQNCRNVWIKRENDKEFIVATSWWCVQREMNGTGALPSDDKLADMYREYFKETDCDLSFKYKPFTLPQTAIIVLVLVDITSPGFFWVQLSDSFSFLNNFMAEINAYYDEHESEHKLHQNVIKPDLACVVRFRGDLRWHRAVVKLVQSTDITVLFVDYGTVDIAHLDDLRALHRKFSLMPIFACPARLANVIPLKKNWSSEAIDFFFSNYINRPLYAQIRTIEFTSRNEYILDVSLFDTSKEEDEDVGMALMINGWATIVSPRNAPVNPTETDVWQHCLPEWLALKEEPESGEEESEASKELNLMRYCCAIHAVLSYFSGNPEKTVQFWKVTLAKHKLLLASDLLSQIFTEIKSPVGGLRFLDCVAEKRMSQTRSSSQMSMSFGPVDIGRVSSTGAGSESAKSAPKVESLSTDDTISQPQKDEAVDCDWPVNPSQDPQNTVALEEAKDDVNHREVPSSWEDAVTLEDAEDDVNHRDDPPSAENAVTLEEPKEDANNSQDLRSAEDAINLEEPLQVANHSQNSPSVESATTSEEHAIVPNSEDVSQSNSVLPPSNPETVFVPENRTKSESPSQSSSGTLRIPELTDAPTDGNRTPSPEQLRGLQTTEPALVSRNVSPIERCSRNSHTTVRSVVKQICVKLEDENSDSGTPSARFAKTILAPNIIDVAVGETNLTLIFTQDGIFVSVEQLRENFCKDVPAILAHSRIRGCGITGNNTILVDPTTYPILYQTLKRVTDLVGERGRRPNLVPIEYASTIVESVNRANPEVARPIADLLKELTENKLLVVDIEKAFFE